MAESVARGEESCPPGPGGTPRAGAEGFLRGLEGEVFRDARFRKLCEIVEGLGSALVAYSGGVDSTLLLRVASGVLGRSALGAIAVSESLDRSELREALASAERLGVPVEVVETREYENPEYRRNEGLRCYHCKRELFGALRRLAAARGIAWVVDGSNADDARDYRPGFAARDEAGVRSPFIEAGLDKAAVRELSRALGLPTWDKPASPCLASRIPHGEEITLEKLRQVEAGEAALRKLGFRVVRVRHHGQVARIEVPESEIPRLLEPEVRAAAVEALRGAGFPFVSVDLEGFRSGSLNEVLREKDVRSAPSGAAGSPA